MSDCIKPINIIPDNNQVVLLDVNKTITVIDNNCCTNVEITQPTTAVVQVLTGPIGPKGEFPTTGSFNLTGSFSVSGSISADYFYGGSFSGSFTGSFSGSTTDTLQDVTNNGNTTTLPITASSYYGNGLQIVGDAVITGSLTITSSNTFRNIGPAQFTGSVDILGTLTASDITGSLYGTSSWAESSSISISSSHSLSSSLASTASYYDERDPVFTAVSGTFALTSSFNSFTSSYYSDSSSFNTRILDDSASISLLSSSFLNTSSSLSIRVTDLESFSSSLNTTFATKTELNAATASLSGSIAALSSSYIAFSGSYNTGSFTGSFVGDGSQLTNLPIPIIDTSSLVTTASFNAFTSSYTTGSFTGSFTGYLTGTSSWAESSSFALTASYVLNIPSIDTGSLLTTASVLLNTITFTKGDGSTFPIIVDTGSGGTGNTFPYTGSAIISGSLILTGSFSSTDGINVQTITASIISASQYTGSIYGTASWATQAITASYITSSNIWGPYGSNSILSASYASGSTSSSYTLSSSYALTASYLSGYTSPFPFTGSAIISGSLQYIDGNQASSKVLTSDVNGNSTWQYPQTTGILAYFFSTASSDITGYSQSLANPQTGSVQIISNVNVTNGQLLAAFITQPNTPGLSFYPAGTVDLHIHAANTNSGKQTQLYFTISKRDTLGNEIPLGTSLYTDIIGGIASGYVTDLYLPITTASVSDRIVTKIYADISGPGTNPDISLYLADNTLSRIQLPGSSINTTNFVPYAGATQNVNLDGFSISASLFTGSFIGGLQGTSSWAQSSSQAISSSYSLNAGSASFATTASYVANASSFPYTGSAIISGSLVLTGSFSSTDGVNVQTITASIVSASQFTGSFSGSGANLSGIPSSAIVGLNLSQIAAGSVTASVTSTQFSVVSGSVTEFLVTGTGVTMGNATSDIHRVTGSLNVAQGITGSLFGTASYVTGSIFTSTNLALSASYAISTSITPSSLTTVNDTNVLLTLGGSSSNALLQATSITASWSGQLAVSRGGTGGSTALAARTSLGINTNQDIYSSLGSVSTQGQTFGMSIINTTGTTTWLDGRATYFLLDPMPGGLTITGVKFWQSTQGNYTADNNNKVGIYSYSGGTLTLVASCADDGNLWKGANNTWQSKAFSSTFVTVANTAYFVAALYNNSAVVQNPIIGASATITAALGTFDFTNSAKIVGFIAAQTDLPATQAMSGLTTLANVPYFALY